ncbi:MAG: hypothetical protein ACYC9M_08550 [Desulfobulbaceae bacterium]
MSVRYSLLPLFIAVLIVLTGCAEKYPRLEVIAPLPDTSGCRVLILPFAYQGDFPRGENILYKAFIAEMAAVPGLDVVAEGDVLQMYKQFRLFPKDQPNEEQLRLLAQRLGAETLVLGDILHMTEVDAGGEVSTELTLVLNLHAGDSGKLLWSTYHKRQGEDYRNVLHYGRVNTMSGLARRMANEIITVWLENGMKQCTP